MDDAIKEDIRKRDYIDDELDYETLDMEYYRKEYLYKHIEDELDIHSCLYSHFSDDIVQNIIQIYVQIERKKQMKQTVTPTKKKRNPFKQIFCSHKREDLAQYIKLPYGYKALFVCKNCGRERTSIC